MTQSILDNIKTLCLIQKEQTELDDVVLLHINSAMDSLAQITYVTYKPFSVQDANKTWAEMFGDRPDLSLIMQYVYLYTRSIFDPPVSGAEANAIATRLDDLAWRINITRKGLPTE